LDKIRRGGGHTDLKAAPIAGNDISGWGLRPANQGVRAIHDRYARTVADRRGASRIHAEQISLNFVAVGADAADSSAVVIISGNHVTAARRGAADGVIRAAHFDTCAVVAHLHRPTRINADVISLNAVSG